MKEMRLMQIIGDIDDKYIEEAAPCEQSERSEKKPAIRFVPWVKYAAAAACAALILGAGIFAVTQRANIVEKPAESGSEAVSSDESGDFVQAVSPYEDFDTLEEAEKAVGFDIAVPDSFVAFTELSFSTVSGKILEVQYYDKDGGCGLSIRKAKGGEDVSGDWNEYESVSEIQAGGRAVTIKGNGGKYYLAVWQDGGYSYSVSVTDGASEDELKAVVEDIQ